MKEFGPIHTLWSASEEDLGDTLKGVASCIDRCCKAMEKRMVVLSETLFPTLHEYVLYSEILMVSWRRCDTMQLLWHPILKGQISLAHPLKDCSQHPVSFVWVVWCLGGDLIVFLQLLSAFLIETQGQIYSYQTM